MFPSSTKNNFRANISLRLLSCKEIRLKLIVFLRRFNLLQKAIKIKLTNSNFFTLTIELIWEWFKKSAVLNFFKKYIVKLRNQIQSHLLFMRIVIHNLQIFNLPFLRLVFQEFKKNKIEMSYKKYLLFNFNN
jgi:hypothetical protein